MKLENVVQLTRDAIAQTMGYDYQPLLDEGGQPISNDELASLPTHKLIDIGNDVTEETKINSFSTGLIALIGRHIIEKRIYTSNLPSLYVESFDWGGFLERTRIGLGEIMSDPMYDLVRGKSYAEIEHTYYHPDVKSKIYAEAKAIMCPVSTQKEMIREAFHSWDKLNEFISAVMAKIRSTINLALAVYEKMLVSSAVAISDAKNDNAIHLISEAVAKGVLTQIDEEGELRNPTYDEVKRNKEFLTFCLERIRKTRDYYFEPSTAFNDGSVPTWADEDPRLILLNDFATNIEFYVKPTVFNPEYLGIGAFDKITSWQGIKDSVSKEFDADVLSSIDIAADPANKLGIGVDGYKKSGVVGLLWDRSAIGISLMRSKVTSSYTACADFWNTFNHQLVNYLIDDSYGMTAFIMD